MVNEDRLVNTLKQVNLTDKEARVYLSLLSLGNTTAYKIAEHSEVKKPTVYVTLDELRKKGLVLKVPHAKKAIFAARDMEEYLQEQRDKLSSVQAVLPRLYALGGEQQPSVFFYSGLKGIKEALAYKFDSMRGKTLYGFYGSLIGVENVKAFSELYEHWDRKALDAGMNFKIVMPKEGSGTHYKYLLARSKEDAGVQIHLLDQYEYPPNASIGIGEDFLWIVDEKNLQATVIDNESTAAAMRQIFEVVWEKGK